MATTHEKQCRSIVPAMLGGCLAVAAAGLAAAVAVPSTTGRLLAVAVTVGILSALLRDPRAWLAVTLAGALTFLLAVDDGENGWPYLIALGVAALLGRGQRWMRHPAPGGGQTP